MPRRKNLFDAALARAAVQRLEVLEGLEDMRGMRAQNALLKKAIEEKDKIIQRFMDRNNEIEKRLVMINDKLHYYASYVEERLAERNDSRPVDTLATIDMSRGLDKN